MQTTEIALEVVAPDTVRYGAEKVRTGGQMYRALKRLLATKPDARGVRRVGLAAWTRAVWGDHRPTVNASTLRGLLFRTNELLGGIGCPLTVSKRSEDGSEWVVLE